MTLRRRILWPVVGLVLLVAVGTTAVSVVLVSGAVERRIADRVSPLGRFISASPGMPLNAQSLGYMRRAFDAELVIAAGGNVMRDLSTIDAARARSVVANPVGRVRGAGFDYYVITSPVVVEGVAATLYILLPGDVVDSETWAALGPLLTLGGISLVLAIALAAALNDRMDRMARAERLASIGKMAAMMAHEVRNPLAAMKMNAQLLEAKAPEHAARLLAEIERLSASIEDLVAAGRPSPPKQESLALDALVNEVVGQLKPRLEHWKTEVRVEGAARANADARRVRSAVTNLILNAAQSMPQGGPVRIAITNGDGAARVTVEDRGGGVPEPMRAKLFEPFATTREEGMGLGLAIAKTFVEECGGRVAYEPIEGGSRFVLELPSWRA